MGAFDERAPLTDTRLENGVRVLVQPRAGAAAAVHLWLDGGAADELPEEHGLAHFLEHMVFKGTATRGLGGSAEAIERANASPFGLGSSVWTRDLHRARQAAERIEAGYTWINSRTKVYDELPFGGWKASGYGKEHGEEAFEHYTETKSVVLRSGA